MTADEWDYLTVKVQAYWPNKPLSDESLELWFADLSEFEAEQVEAAIIALYRDGREWAPNGAQIRLKLIELRRPAVDPGEAYELTMRAAGEGGGFNTGLEWLAERSPIAAQAAQQYGWREFCLEDSSDTTRRAQYRDIFNRLAERGSKDQRYLGIEADGLDGLPTGPRRIGEVIRLLPGQGDVE